MVPAAGSALDCLKPITSSESVPSMIGSPSPVTPPLDMKTVASPLILALETANGLRVGTTLALSGPFTLAVTSDRLENA